MDDANIDISAIENGIEDWIRAWMNPDMESNTSGGPGSRMKNLCNAWLHVEGTDSSSSATSRVVLLMELELSCISIMMGDDATM